MGNSVYKIWKIENLVENLLRNLRNSFTFIDEFNVDMIIVLLHFCNYIYMYLIHSVLNDEAYFHL